MSHDASVDFLDATTCLASAYFSRNAVPADQISQIMASIHQALTDLVHAEAEPEPLKPAVPIKKSVTPDYIICLEDGKQLKMLKRHLRTTYDMTPAEYRAKWGLPRDYPMVAPNYAKHRSEFAKKIGLGTASAGKKRRGRGGSRKASA